MDWYYLSDSHERIAVNEAQLAPLAARGVLRPATPVWRKGMGDWAACGEVKPEIFTAAVSGSDDQPHSGAASAVMQGTVMGLARTLAGYNVWLRIFGIALLIFAVLMAASEAWTLWWLFKADEADWTSLYSALHQTSLPKAAVWAVVAFQAISLLLAGWAGWVLLLAAARAKRAAQTGSEPVLAQAIRDTGRYFILSVVILLTAVVFWAAMVVWLGWNVAWPEKSKPAEKVITV